MKAQTAYWIITITILNITTHRMPHIGRMNTNLIRNILNIIFMVLALAAVLTYFFVSDFKVFIYVCAAAIFTKLIEFFLRFMC